MNKEYFDEQKKLRGSNFFYIQKYSDDPFFIRILKQYVIAC